VTSRLALLAAVLLLTACAQGLAAPALPQPFASPISTVTPTPPASPAPAQTHKQTYAFTPTHPTPTLAASPTPIHTVVERGLLAPGFSLTVYAAVPAPTSLAFGPDGRLYAGSTNSAVYAVADNDGDHRGDGAQPFAVGLDTPLGLAWVGQELFVSVRGSVVAVSDTNGDGFAETRRTVIANLPSFGLHQNDSLALGADGYLYLGQGSTCDHCSETDPRSGTILRFKPDGAGFSVYARGMRNPYGLAFNSMGDLFATDNDRDDLGPTLPPEELNFIRQGLDYGWPDCWPGRNVPACASVAQPVATFTPHTSADGLAFYEAHQFPREYFDNAFVAVLGSIYMFPTDTERGVARVRLTRTSDGYTGQREWFLQLPDGRPVAVTVGPDGGLYVADYENGLIYRIVYGAP
jgi:putative membrane-bound dehydrogenase-like protein